MKKKKVLLICGVSLDVAVTITLFVFSIIMLANAGLTETERKALPKFPIGWLVTMDPLIYGLAFVVPLFVLLAANVIGLVLYVRANTKKEPVKVNDLSDEQKEALRKELLKDLSDKKDE